MKTYTITNTVHIKAETLEEAKDKFYNTDEVSEFTQEVEIFESDPKTSSEFTKLTNKLTEFGLEGIAETFTDGEGEPEDKHLIFDDITEAIVDTWTEDDEERTGLGGADVIDEAQEIVEELFYLIGAKNWYKCHWDKATFLNSNFESGSIQPLNIFSETNGYTPEDIRAIERLEVGEIWTSSIYGKTHTVKRLY